MARIVWNAADQRAFEMGLDRGILHVEGKSVIPWNGLVSVTENPKGAEVKAVYQDSFRIHNHSGVKEFEATIEAFNYPDEFGLCEGLAPDSAAVGLIIDQQPPRTFDLAYRTGIGTGLLGEPTAYKLHLVYSGSVAPSSKAYRTRSNSTDLVTHSWAVATVPRWDLVGVLPSAHFVIDSTKADPAALKSIEDILYGTSTKAPRFIEPLEVKNILSGG